MFSAHLVIRSMIHISAEARELMKDFQCAYCPKQFLRRSVLAMHEASHTGDYKFQCKLCPKKFAYSAQCKLAFRSITQFALRQECHVSVTSRMNHHHTNFHSDGFSAVVRYILAAHSGDTMFSCTTAINFSSTKTCKRSLLSYRLSKTYPVFPGQHKA